jgi:hypothetical protein
MFAIRWSNGSPLPLPRMCVDMTIATRPSGEATSCSTSTRHSSQVKAISRKYLRMPANPLYGVASSWAISEKNSISG